MLTKFLKVSNLFIKTVNDEMAQLVTRIDTAENPEEAADMLIAGDNTGSLAEAEDLVKASQKFLSPLYIDDADRWGVIDADRWNGFYKWLYENELCAKDLTDIGFSNEYLPE